jgi:hypothetical protein
VDVAVPAGNPANPQSTRLKVKYMSALPLRRNVSTLGIGVSILLGILVPGCVSTREVTVDYPVPPPVVQAINDVGGRAVIVLQDSEIVSAQQLTLDSMTARWLDGEWRVVPIADVVSLTVQDPSEKGNRLVTGVLYSAAAFGAIGLIDGISQDKPDAGADALLMAVAGGLAAAVTYDFWGPMTEPRLQYTIRSPRSAQESLQRDMDRNRLEAETRATTTELNMQSRNLRVEPTFVYGRGNEVESGSDPSSPFVVGGGVNFGVRFWDQIELGLELIVASHSFNRTNPDESVTRFCFVLKGTFFPMVQSGLFVRGGIGYGAYSASGTYTGTVQTIPAVTPSTVTGEGLTLTIGAGYDIRLADAWSIRPGVQYNTTPLGNLELNDQAVIATGKTSSMLTVVVSIVFKGVI